MIIGLLTIGIGFVLMAGGKSDDPNISKKITYKEAEKIGKKWEKV